MSPNKTEKAAAPATQLRHASENRRTPLRTTVVGSYPFPGWLEFASAHLDQFGEADIEEMQNDAVIAAVHDQVAAGLDVITDGEQTRYDFNLSFYGRLEGIRRHRDFAAPLRTAGARSARKIRDHGKYKLRARPGSGGRVQAPAENRAARAGAESQRPRTLYAERPHRSRRQLQRPLGRHRSADSDRSRRA